MKNLLCIVGTTGSGKDTLSRKLEKKYGLRSVVSFTTRPIRENEQHGREHYFISDEAMDSIMDTQTVVAATEINGCRYCSTIEELKKSDIYCIDPDGIRYLRNKVNPDEINLIVVYVLTKRTVRRQRIASSGRGKDALEMFEKRSASEEPQFTEFLVEEGYDYIVDNNNTPESAMQQLDAIVEKHLLQEYSFHVSVEPAGNMITVKAANVEKAENLAESYVNDRLNELGLNCTDITLRLAEN